MPPAWLDGLAVARQFACGQLVRENVATRGKDEDPIGMARDPEPFSRTGTTSNVLCVDLDGTLLATDILWESLFLLLRQKPVHVLRLPFWLVRGKAYFKRKLAETIELDVSILPYRLEVLDYLVAEHKAGRELALATATDNRVAVRVAKHLGLFAHVFASDGTVNLGGAKKAARLAEHFGQGKFDYAGNGHVDLAAWELGDRAVVVSRSARLLRKVQKVANVERVFGSHRGLSPRALFKVLRPHQWVKNLLVFVPLVTSHRLFDAASLPPAFLAFCAFSLCASGVYVINDALDVEADRQHPRKKRRPFASGELPLSMAVVLVPVLLLSAFALAAFTLPVAFALVLLLYLATTTAYSIWLKREPVLDVILLSGLYTLRLLAGGVAVGISVSAWLLSFSLFLFLSLALMKRFSELKLVAEGQGKVVRRGYRGDDMAWLQSAGFASAYLTVLVLALYINSDDVRVLYSRPEMLWGLCPLAMYWVTRLWFTANRGRLNDDPIVAAATDPSSYAVAVLSVLVLMAAL